MKKLIICLFTALIAIPAFSQNDFPGIHADLLLGKEVKVNPRPEVLQKYGYENFYKDEKLNKKFACCESYNSKYSKLVDKIFKVANVVTTDSNFLGATRFKLKLSNTETGDIYYDYNPKYEFNFPFTVIGGLTWPEGYFCSDIEKKEDKFTGEITYSAPEVDGISFIKIVDKKQETLYIYKRQFGSTANVGIKGLTLLLKNQDQIKKPEADISVEVSSNGRGYIYSTMVKLNDDDIKALLENEITDTRVYIYDGTVTNGKKLIEYLKCLTKKT